MPTSATPNTPDITTEARTSNGTVIVHDVIKYEAWPTGKDRRVTVNMGGKTMWLAMHAVTVKAVQS